MLTMSETPKSFFPMATPEDVKKASEQAMNLWIGALSPMWVPFMAASAFGMSAYAAGKTLQKDLVGELPLAPRWPGFAPLWGQTDFTPQVFEQSVVDAAQAVEDAFAPVEAAAESLIQATVESVAAMTAVASPPEVVAAVETETVVEPVAEVAAFAEAPVVEVPVSEPQDIEAPVVEATETEVVAAEAVAADIPLMREALASEALAPDAVAAKGDAAPAPDTRAARKSKRKA